MDLSAFSHDSYIIDQLRTGAAPYGAGTSDKNGCGWISAYNFLRLQGLERNWQRVVTDMERGSIFRCKFGTSPFRLLRYLRRRGCKLKQAWGRRAAIRLAERGSPGILLYRHGNGLHFVAFAPDRGGKLRFFNAILGAERHVQSMQEFLDVHAHKWPVACACAPMPEALEAPMAQ